MWLFCFQLVSKGFQKRCIPVLFQEECLQYTWVVTTAQAITASQKLSFDSKSGGESRRNSEDGGTNWTSEHSVCQQQSAKSQTWFMTQIVKTKQVCQDILSTEVHEENFVFRLIPQKFGSGLGSNMAKRTSTKVYRRRFYPGWRMGRANSWNRVSCQIRYLCGLVQGKMFSLEHPKLTYEEIHILYIYIYIMGLLVYIGSFKFIMNIWPKVQYDCPTASGWKTTAQLPSSVRFVCSHGVWACVSVADHFHSWGDLRGFPHALTSWFTKRITIQEGLLPNRANSFEHMVVPGWPAVPLGWQVPSLENRRSASTRGVTIQGMLSLHQSTWTQRATALIGFYT